MRPPFPPLPKCKVCNVEISHTAKNGLCAKHARKQGIVTGPTSEERSNFKLCGAKKKDGSRCRAYAGQGTEHFGTGRCKNHMGNTPAANKAAILIQAQADMVKLGVPIVDIDGPRALAGLLRATAGHCSWLQAEIAGLEDLADPEARVLIDLYSSERDRLTRIAQACVSSGIAERYIKIQEAQTLILGRALRRAAEAAGFTERQMERLGKALRTELAAVEVEDAGVWGQPAGWDVEAHAVEQNGRR
jgi:hypothetical protein